MTWSCPFHQLHKYPIKCCTHTHELHLHRSPSLAHFGLLLLAWNPGTLSQCARAWKTERGDKLPVTVWPDRIVRDYKLLAANSLDQLMMCAIVAVFLMENGNHIVSQIHCLESTVSGCTLACLRVVVVADRQQRGQVGRQMNGWSGVCVCARVCWSVMGMLIDSPL